MAISPATLAPLAEPVTREASLPSAAGASGADGAFPRVLQQMLDGAAQNHAGAEAAVQDLALGRTDNLHTVMLQMAQADLSFRLVLEIRNRLTKAYQEIMKMQV